jgi:chemotaxis-related protein WspB
MLFLLFHIGTERYVLEASRVIEVLPLVNLKKIPQAPKGFAGLMNYRGRPVPAIDLCELTLGEPARERLSTRIILVKYPQEGESDRVVGLIAEHATEMLRKEPNEFVDPGFKNAGAPYLGPIVLDPGGAIQWIRTEHLLTTKIRELVFSEVALASP